MRAKVIQESECNGNISRWRLKAGPRWDGISASKTQVWYEQRFEPLFVLDFKLSRRR